MASRFKSLMTGSISELHRRRLVPSSSSPSTSSQTSSRERMASAREWTPSSSPTGLRMLLVPGFRNIIVNTRRLCSSKTENNCLLKFFNAGDYVQAVMGRHLCENFTHVVYPNHNMVV